MTDPYSTGILSLVFGVYEPKKELVLSMLLTCYTLVMVLSEAYFLLVRENAIIALEEMDPSRKQALWDQSAGQRDRVRWCRAVHLLNSI